MSIIRRYPSGYGGQMLTWPQIALRSDVRMLDPQFRYRLHRMMIAAHKQGVALGIGGAGRSTAQQTALFLARHYEDPSGAIMWNGKRWSRKPGMAAAAPSGRSYHEETTPAGKALAADMVGDLNWMRRNCGWFGLKEFSQVNNEPWHVQPSEVPTSRAQYSPAVHHPLKRWFKK